MKWVVNKRFPNGKACSWKSGDWTVTLYFCKDGLSTYAGFFKEEKEARFFTDDQSEVEDRIKDASRNALKVSPQG